MADDAGAGWEIVRRKGSTRTKYRRKKGEKAKTDFNYQKRGTLKDTSAETSNDVVARVTTEIQDLVGLLHRTRFFLNLLKILQKSRSSHVFFTNRSVECTSNAPTTIVCYGLGSFSTSHHARYQLACALALRNRFSSTSCSSGVSKEANQQRMPRVLLFDPVMSEVRIKHLWYCTRPSELLVWRGQMEAEWSNLWCLSVWHECIHVKNQSALDHIVFLDKVDVLISQQFGCSVETENKMGKHTIPRDSAAGWTLFFMPHCPMRLYSNVLWANWSLPVEHSPDSAHGLSSSLPATADSSIFDSSSSNSTKASCKVGGGGGLCNITVVGNSFQGYLDRTINASDREDQVLYVLDQALFALSKKHACFD